jgi:Asp-tRNA(Asn)/Glu-tRNA(Gln) amidotransferase A subunit family amidase
MRGITKRLLATLRASRIPAIGFVNEFKLETPGEETARTALLAAWLDAGHDLGNHTYRHRRLFDTPLEEFQADVLRGERVTRELMDARGRPLRYFRHPTLNTGPDPATRAAFENFLAGHGYRVAPVTVDNDEYLYALAYDRARARKDRALAERLGRDYLRYMGEIFDFYERLSRRLFGREIPQVLLLHANALNADYLDELAAMTSARGYRAISLDQALQDEAYRTHDGYVGDRGISWLQRWAITRGEDPGAQPPIPNWVQAATR